MQETVIRTGLVGAGYIASWHVQALKGLPNVKPAAVCDVNRDAAEELARKLDVPAFSTLEQMIAAQTCDTVHVLTPPRTHCQLAIDSLNAGLHVLVEKPVGPNAEEVERMRRAAGQAGRLICAGHNFLGLPAYERLKRTRDAGTLGRIASAEINWRFPLQPLRSGPFNLWLLREPQNLLLELGPHVFAFAQDLFGDIEILHLDLGKPIGLPGGDERNQSWRVLARAGRVDITLTLSLVEGPDDRSVILYGSSGIAKMDFANDTLEIRTENASDIVLNSLKKEFSLSWQHLSEGVSNSVRQLRSLNQKAPYALSFSGMFGSFYGSIRSGKEVDRRFSIESAAAVMNAIDQTISLMPPTTHKARKAVRKPKPSALVIGGTGFVGRYLTRRLTESGHDVRVVTRGSGGPFDDLPDHVETVSVSLNDEAGLKKAMDGIEVVYNLAKSTDQSWGDALKNDVGVTVRIAQAAISAGVTRFIYTGTIASYDMSDPKQVITEDTGFGGDMDRRNIYARSKAECEARLRALQKNQGLPLIIARPGIVVGKGGPLQHWGLGRWHGAGAVRIWGNGRNILPFVLADDTADALVRMMTADDIIGLSFNIVGEPMLSALDYFEAIHERLGAQLIVRPGSLYGFYFADRVKYILKRYGLGKTDLALPSLNDWLSRGHLSSFDNTRAKEVLGWRPEPDRAEFIERAIVKAELLGF